jgi:hypothetical protein
VTEAELRALAIAAIEKIEGARSGRVRSEISGRSVADPSDSVGAIFDRTFDYDRQAIAATKESSSGLSHYLSEIRDFPAEDLHYFRVSGTDDNGDPIGSEDGFEAEPDNTVDSEVDRWSVMSFEQFGVQAAGMIPPEDYAWAKALLSEPTQKALVIEESSERATIELRTRLDHLAAYPSFGEEFMSDYTPDTPVLVRLVLDHGSLANLTVVFEAEKDGLIFQMGFHFWRIGEPVVIEKPAPPNAGRWYRRSIPPSAPLNSITWGVISNSS